MIETLGNLGDFIGGIAVVITLMYLAIQIRQNTRAVRASSRQAVVDSYRTLNRLLIDPSVARSFSTGLTSYPNLPFEERSRFSALMNEHVLFFQSVLALFESGQLEDHTYNIYREWIATVIASPGGSAWWNTVRPIYTNATVEALDERLKSGGLQDVLKFDAYRIDGEPCT